AAECSHEYRQCQNGQYWARDRRLGGDGGLADANESISSARQLLSLLLDEDPSDRVRNVSSEWRLGSLSTDLHQLGVRDRMGTHRRSGDHKPPPAAKNRAQEASTPLGATFYPSRRSSTRAESRPADLGRR